MTRWLVPGAFLAIACTTGVRAQAATSLFTHHPSVRHLLLALYGLASLVYRIVVVAGFLYLTYVFLKEHHLRWLGLTLVRRICWC